MRDARALRKHILRALGSYWPEPELLEQGLSLPELPLAPPDPGRAALAMVELPAWASDLAADGGLLIPSACIAPGEGEPWSRADWLGAAFWHLHGVAERAFERQNGSIFSYSVGLRGFDPRLWERAWVNRIALFLRRLAARALAADEARLFGPRPAARILLTHDLDAVRKTWPIRIKQPVFHVFNAARLGLSGRWRPGIGRLAKAAGFAFGSGRYDNLGWMAEREERLGMRSRIHVFAGLKRGLRLALMDPGYDPAESPLPGLLRDLRARGFEIGLHQSFGTWREARPMEEERGRLEAVLDHPVSSCRQHWLRFSWAGTWRAQAAAGLREDATLGFNDRPGFRCGAALRFNPWDEEHGRRMNLTALPMVLMDSHLYDYAGLDREQRRAAMARVIREVRAVGGEASVLWHPHTLSPDYGWAEGFEELLSVLREG